MALIKNLDFTELHTICGHNMNKIKRCAVLCIVVLSIFTACQNEENYTMEDMKPYLAHASDVIDSSGFVHLSEEEYNSISAVDISGIEGTVSYALEGIDRVFNIPGIVKWKSNESDLSAKDYEKINKTIANFYSIEDLDTTQDKKEYVFDSIDQYSQIKSELLEDGSICIEWYYDTDRFDKNKVAAYAAVKCLTDVLKNPDSLQIHDIAYSEKTYGIGFSDDCIGIRIEYSAQNGFGGYNREYYYVILDPDNYYERQSTALDTEGYMSREFTSISMDEFGISYK